MGTGEGAIVRSSSRSDQSLASVITPRRSLGSHANVRDCLVQDALYEWLGGTPFVSFTKTPSYQQTLQLL